MLSVLHIENIAVIESADIAFDPKLNVLTGETGAGKSIVIDALGAVLGFRASRDLIRSGCDRASVAAVFFCPGAEAEAWLSQFGAEPGEELLLSRELLLDGRNLCKIAGKPATVANLRELGALLVQVHGQHDSLQLLRDDRHLELLDAFGGIDTSEYAAAHAALLTVRAKMDALAFSEAEKAERIDRLQFRLREIDEAELRAHEEDELLERRVILQNTEKIFSSVTRCRECLRGGDDLEGVSSLLGMAADAMRGISALREDYEKLSAALNQVLYMVEDIAEELSTDDLDAAPGELDRVEQRLDVYYRLKRKYGLSAGELLIEAEKWREELEQIELSDQKREQLALEETQLLQKTRRLADALTKARQAAAGRFEARVCTELSELDMASVQFKVDFAKRDFGPSGADTVSFLLGANVGEPLKPLSKTASGGELSRVMLAMINTQNTHSPTMVFDEVDAGVSGRAAQKVAQKLCAVSRLGQVLCVTHLPQIAAMADTHFHIEKGVTGDRTVTTVSRLDDRKRVDEIARIIGGSVITDKTRESAGELIAQAGMYKQPKESRT